MSERDPFADPAFAERAAKLLAMLSTAHPAEADTARRKLLALIQAHGLSMTELAQRLRTGPAAAPDAGERARRLAEETRRLMRLAAAAETRAAAASVAQARAERRAHRLGLLAAGLAAALAGSITLLVLALPGRRDTPPVPVAAWSPPPREAGPRYVASTAALFAIPSPEARVRALLPRGTQVVVLRQMRRGGLSWVQVRSPLGEGWLTENLLAP